MAVKKAITREVRESLYQINTDGILGAKPRADGENIPSDYAVLRGQVTGADLVAAGVDIEWLLNTGQITKLGFSA